MATFDQRNQKVSGNQYNLAGNINFGTIQNKSDIPIELQKLIVEVNKAVQSGVLSAERAVEVEAKIKKAVVETEKPKPNPKTVLDYLSEAKVLLEGFTSAAGLVTVLVQAADMVRRLFFL